MGLKIPSKGSNSEQKKNLGRNELDGLSHFLNSSLRGLIRFLSSLAGGILLISSIILAFALFILFQYDGGFMFWGHSPEFTIPMLMNWLDYTGHDAGLSYVLIIALLGLPVIILLYTGIRLLFGSQVRIPGAFPTLFSIWIVAALALTYISLRVANDFHEHESIERIEAQLPNDTLGGISITVDVPGMYEDKKTKERRAYLADEEMRMPLKHDSSGFIGRSEIRILAGQDTGITISTRREAYGGDMADATQNLDGISYIIQTDSSSCSLSPVFHAPNSEGWRNQRLIYLIYLPENGVVRLTADASRYLTSPTRYSRERKPLILRNVNGKIRQIPDDKATSLSFKAPGITFYEEPFLL